MKLNIQRFEFHSSVTRSDAEAAKQNVQKQFNDVKDNITNDYNAFDAAMSIAMTGPTPSANLTAVADGCNRVYTEGRVSAYFDDRAKAAVAAYNNYAANAGADGISAKIDTSPGNVRHDSNADTEKLQVYPEHAHEAVQALTKLQETLNSIGGQAINTNIEGDIGVESALISNARRNMTTLNTTFASIAEDMLKYFENLSDADKESLNSIISSLEG